MWPSRVPNQTHNCATFTSRLDDRWKIKIHELTRDNQGTIADDWMQKLAKDSHENEDAIVKEGIMYEYARGETARNRRPYGGAYPKFCDPEQTPP